LTHFRTTAREELPALIEFLKRLSSGPESATLLPEHLIWKYYEPRADWEGSRSYVLEEDGRIVAHLATMPSRLRLGSRTVTCTHFIDWVADPGAPLAGSVLLRKITRMFDVTFCIGGSLDNRRLLPKFGFQPSGRPAAIYARPIRPFRQVLDHQTKDWRLPLRLARNLAFSVTPLATPGSWKAVTVLPRDVSAKLWDAPGSGGAMHERSAAKCEYFLHSKHPEYEFFLLEQDGRPSGGLLLAFPPGQGRIVDIWLSDPSLEAFVHALVAAQRACMKREGVHEVMFRASTPMLREAAQRSGLRFMKEDAIMTYPAKEIGEECIEAPLIADDAAYLYSPQSRYLT